MLSGEIALEITIVIITMCTHLQPCSKWLYTYGHALHDWTAVPTYVRVLDRCAPVQPCTGWLYLYCTVYTVLEGSTQFSSVLEGSTFKRMYSRLQNGHPSLHF